MLLVKLFELMIVVCYQKRSHQCYEKRENIKKKRKKRKKKRRKRSQRNIIGRVTTPTTAMNVIQEEIEEMIRGTQIDNEIDVTQTKEELREVQEIWREPEMEESMMIRQEMIAKEDPIVLMIAKSVGIMIALALEKDLVEVEVALENEEREEQKDPVLGIERPRDGYNPRVESSSS